MVYMLTKKAVNKTNIIIKKVSIWIIKKCFKKHKTNIIPMEYSLIIVLKASIKDSYLNKQTE